MSVGPLWGFLVTDARGEPYALRESYEAATRARAHGEAYLDGAATCGHPAAARWVAKRLPLRIRQVTAEERDAVLEEWGQPVLDREP